MFIRTWSVAFSCFVKAHPYAPFPHCFVSGVYFFNEAVVFFKRDLTRDSSELRIAKQEHYKT